MPAEDKNKINTVTDVFLWDLQDVAGVKRGCVLGLKKKLVRFLGIDKDPKKEPDKELKTLKELFKQISQYQGVMRALIDKKLINEITHQHIDTEKGNKALLVAIIKSLHPKGYLERKPSNDEIKKIAKDEFGCVLSDGTVKNTNAGDHRTDFIPYCPGCPK